MKASTSVLSGRRGTWRHRSSLCLAGVALMARTQPFHFTHHSVTDTYSAYTSITHLSHAKHLSHATSCNSFTYSSVTHTQLLHTQHCHTQLFHTHVTCNALTRNFVTHNSFTYYSFPPSFQPVGLPRLNGTGAVAELSCFFPHSFVWGSCFWLCTSA